MVMVTDIIPDLHLVSPGSNAQCFPYYIYAEDGSNQRENITDWALGQFRACYGEDVTKRDSFHYVYGMLHHPQYRERYAENLKRELPYHASPYFMSAEHLRHACVSLRYDLYGR